MEGEGGRGKGGLGMVPTHSGTLKSYFIASEKRGIDISMGSKHLKELLMFCVGALRAILSAAFRMTRGGERGRKL